MTMMETGAKANGHADADLVEYAPPSLRAALDVPDGEATSRHAEAMAKSMERDADEIMQIAEQSCANLRKSAASVREIGALASAHAASVTTKAREAATESGAIVAKFASAT